MVATLFSIGALGLLGMTWLFPLTGRFFWRVKSSGDGGRAGMGRLRRISILIPAHNEQEKIIATLQSMQRSIRYAGIYYPEIDIRITVGADGCTDRTARLASSSGAEVSECLNRRGKWRTLVDLIEGNPDADWIVLADCGVIWPEDFLARALAYCSDPQIIGIAPTYDNPRAGLLEKIHWQIEKHFKRLESLAGGPVSIHGATVLYRRHELAEAIRGLPAINWLNDDVVLPLALRTINPAGRIVYLDRLGVFDHVPLSRRKDKPAPELGRRKRMAMGNAQWIRRLFLSSLRSNAVVGTLAMRRIFRIFWAYWFLLIYLAGSGVLMNLSGEDTALQVVLLASPLTICLVIPALRRVLEAACASLLAPYFLVTQYQLERAVWR